MSKRVSASSFRLATPEIRIDQLTGARVLLAPGRAERPEQFGLGSWQPAGSEGCPFCEGNEASTPPEIEAERADGSPADGPGWRTRTIPNLFPALIPESGTEAESGPSAAFASSADPLLASSRGSEPDLFASRPAVGHHEVIVNSPHHLSSIDQLDSEGMAAAMAAWRSRMRAHSDSPYVQLILNQGPDSGASIEHSHAQVGSAPFVPAAVARERERFSSYRERTAGASLLGEVLREEIRRGERLVAIDEEVALICPWASRFPFEMRLIPRRPAASFENDDCGAEMLHRAVGALASLVEGGLQMNLWVKTAPRGVEHFHWHLDFAPRLEPSSSFEMATGVDINVVTPEGAAEKLREVIA
jgi:UDPglucose--hexose-1-phosphate uridylyltransferase